MVELRYHASDRHATSLCFCPPANVLPAGSEALLESTTKVLITHEHPDHLDSPAVKWIKSRALRVWCSSVDAPSLKHKGLDAKPVTFLLTKETTADAIVDHVRRTRVNTVQIVDDEVPRHVFEPIREALPSLKIIQVIHVQVERSIERAISVSCMVDALLLDSGNPTAAIRELGGTGRVHNWDISRQVVEQSEKPIFLAGGISAMNVVLAVSRARPFGIDIGSGVRTDEKLNRGKLTNFVTALKSAVF